MRKEKNPWNLFWIAWTFYTRIPSAVPLKYSPEALHGSRAYFPVVGLLVGAFAALVFWMCFWLWPLYVAIPLSMAAGIWLTGGFHEDGLADSLDGLGGGWNREQILRIMQDSRIGTFGSLALILALSVKFAAGYSVALQNPAGFAYLCVFAHTASRYLASSPVDFMEYARDNGGKSKPMAHRAMTLKASVPGLLVLIVSALLLHDHPIWILGFLPATLFVFYWASKLKRWVGGYTGDSLGALQQLTELILWLFAAMEPL